MGSSTVVGCTQVAEKQRLLRTVARDLRALQRMLDEGMFDETARIGAEQEFMIVDQALNPAPIALQLLERLKDPRFTTELGRFNLEANLSPVEFKDRCLHQLGAELDELCALAREACRAHGAELGLCGIWPTFDAVHARISNLTPLTRFAEFNRQSLHSHGGRLHLQIAGVDALSVTQDNILLEAGPTSFQVHLQVAPSAFTSTFNAALVIAAPLVAIAANASIVAGKRLWHETRIPLLERSADMRHPAQTRRGGRSRTSLGHGFLKTSVLEAFRADLAAFDAVVGLNHAEDSLELLARGEVPKLHALNAFNGTIWRWVRPCYGVTNGQPHLRIENRVISAGPTTRDEIANTALWLGLAVAVPEMFGDVSALIDFKAAEANLAAAARSGLDAELQWLGGRHVSVRELFEGQLLDLASYGLLRAGVDDRDARGALDIIAERLRSGRTGAGWMREVYAEQPADMRPRERAFVIASALKRWSWSGLPVHAWPVAGNQTPREDPSILVALRCDVPTVTPNTPLDVVQLLLEADPDTELLVEDEDGNFHGLLGLPDVQAFVARKSDGSATALDVVRTDVQVFEASRSVREAWQSLVSRGHRTGVVMRGGTVEGVVRTDELAAIRARYLRPAASVATSVEAVAP